jgi:hypothetical protein
VWTKGIGLNYSVPLSATVLASINKFQCPFNTLLANRGPYLVFDMKSSNSACANVGFRLDNANYRWPEVLESPTRLSTEYNAFKTALLASSYLFALPSLSTQHNHYLLCSIWIFLSTNTLQHLFKNKLYITQSAQYVITTKPVFNKILRMHSLD